MLVYVLKSAACLAILLAFYTFFMEKENMHTLKRFYLLGALVAALTIPFVTFVEYVEIVPSEIATMEVLEIPTVTSHVQKQTPIDYLPIALWSMYILGALLYGFKFVRNLAVIIQRIRKNPKYRVHHIYNVLLSESVVPHTFLSYIFLNKQKFEARQIPKEVLLHEQTHARQKHSWDVLFIEFLQVIFWFNPMIPLTKKAIKLNHEFLADLAVLNKGFKPASYQNTLLEFSSPDSYHDYRLQLANAINYSSIKKRFTVMKTRTSKKTILLRSLLFLPLFALLLYSFSNAKIIQIQKTETHTSKKSLDSSQTVHPEKETTAKETLQISASLIQNDSLKFIKDWYITIDGKKYYYLRDANRDWYYYDSTKKEVNLDIVAEYKKKYNEYNTLKNTGTHYIHKSKNEQILLDVLFSDLGGMYFRMSRAIRLKIKQSISPYAPYMKLVKNGQTVYKKQDELTKEDKILLPPPPPYFPKKQQLQEGATKKQLLEFNTLAKKYNSLSKDNFRIIGIEVNHLEHLYSLMTDEQKKKSEPFPNFPPPPSPPYAVPEHRENYSKALLKAFDQFIEKGDTYGKASTDYMKNGNGNIKDLQRMYKEVMRLYDSYVELAVKENLMKLTPRKAPGVKKGGENNVSPPPVSPGEISAIPPPPPSPKSPVEHVVEMAEKNAIFYFEGNEISSDKAVELLKNSNKINLRTRHEGLKRPIVELSTSPIIIEN